MLSCGRSPSLWPRCALKGKCVYGSENALLAFTYVIHTQHGN